MINELWGRFKRKKLEDCPFCGKKAILKAYETENCHKDIHWGCGCQSHDDECCGSVLANTNFSTPAAAIYCWNRRAE